ncbi:MAG: response regulator [Candidatus Eisenbacteria bacterium]|uniref:Response regulator n=1 Tax=Eiseniibacteriota bacterium TaxID=2212470 RepID=A0A938BPX8_UNCEI|nr:response regulator [Candidatus Eisenbacteria bacterium]
MPLKLMTVDDSATIRRIVASCAAGLAPEVEVLEAEHGQRCLDLVARSRPDIIILDINMPVMGGEECLRRLKENPETAAIPVVMLTTESEKAVVLRMLRMGIAQFMIKPFTREEFGEKVGAVLEQHGLAELIGPLPLLPPGEYLLVVEDKPKVIEQIRAGAPEAWGIVATADPREALRILGARAPIAVVANLGLGPEKVFEMFAHMRRTPERQGVRYVASCLRTNEDLQARARAHGYLQLLLKPFTPEEMEALLRGWRRADVRATPSGDAYVIQAARGRFSEQADALLAAIDRAAEEGFVKILVELSPVDQADQERAAMWKLIADHASALGVRAIYVTRLEKVRTWLRAGAETRGLPVVAEVTEGLAALAA